MMTSTYIHLNENTPIQVRMVENCGTTVSLCMDNWNSIFFKNEAHLRQFAETILQQLDNKEEQSA
jgi:hypothetical protein